MPNEDRTLVCSECQSDFVFTKGEQDFYQEKGLTSEPKRCKVCRDARKKRKPRRKDDGIYRSPAFEASAPSHQKIRGRRDFRAANRDYRSPGLNERGSKQSEYRSPAFRDINVLKPEEEYRAPGFREFDAVDPKDEYRAPGFSEFSDINIRDEYRAPGFQGLAQKYIDEKPMFSITCAACGQEAMIPFLPDEDEDAYCKPCFAEKKARLREEAAAAQAAAAEAAAVEAAAAEAAAESAPEAVSAEALEDVPQGDSMVETVVAED